MTLQDLRNRLSWLRENGANVDRTVCELWIYEYLSDKTELPRNVFSEIEKYIRISYCDAGFNGDVLVKRYKLFEHVTEEDKKKIGYFQYKGNEGIIRKIKIVD